MALQLSLSIEERNDNKSIIITDNTGISNLTDWGQGGNISYTALDNASYELSLDISVTNSLGVTTDYDTIDLVDEFGPFVDYDDLQFLIDNSLLLVNGTAVGTADTELTDGIWAFTYTITAVGVGEYSKLEVEELIVGVVRLAVYEMLREIPVSYMCKECCNSREIKDAIFANNYLKAMEISFELNKTEDVISYLNTLKRMVLNGSNCTW